MAKSEDTSFLSDEELVHRYRNSHDTAYIGELYVRYTHLAYAVCLKYFHHDADAQDAVMQIFEKLIVELKKHHIETFRPWLHTVVKNHCMMHFRKEATVTKQETQLKNNLKGSVESDESDHLDTEAEKEVMVSYLATGMDALRDEQRTCVELFYLKDMSYQQIADQTGYTLNEVKSYIQNGKRNLKNYITEKSHGKSRHINLTQDGVISQEALMAYAAGRLSPAEVAEVDKLLQSDEFAREALDGIRQANDSGQMATAVTAINTRLIEKTGAHLRQQKSAKIHWSVYAYAALILGVLIGVGFVMIHIYSGRSADADINKGIVQGQQSMPVAEPKKEEPKPDTALLAAQMRDSMAKAKAADSISLVMDDTVANATATSSGKPVEIAMSKSAEPMVAEKKNIPVSKPAVDAKAPLMLSRTQASDPVTAQLSAAMTFFESGDYANAERKYNEILATQPGNVDALYFGGVASYINGSKGFGEANFDKLLKSGYYPEGTTWYKANILIRKGQKDQAKELLRSLINSNSSFKDRAIKKYEELWTPNK